MLISSPLLTILNPGKLKVCQRRIAGHDVGRWQVRPLTLHHVCSLDASSFCMVHFL